MPMSGTSRMSFGSTEMMSETVSTSRPTVRGPAATMITTCMLVGTVTPVPNRARRSKMGTMMPRRLMTPRTWGGAFGIMVVSVQPLISRTTMMSMPYSSAPSVKVMNCCAFSLTAASWPNGAIGLLSGCMGQVLCGFWSRLLRGRQPFWRAAHVDLVQARDVKDQRDAAIAEDRGAADAVHRLVIGFEALHHHLLLAEEFVDNNADTAGALALHDDHDAPAGIADRIADREHAMQIDQRQI